MLTIIEDEILKDLLPNDIYLLVIDVMNILNNLKYEDHMLEIENIFTNIDNEKSDLKSRLIELLSIHINIVSSRLGLIFSTEALLSTRASIVKTILSLDDIDYDLRIKLLEDMQQLDGDNVDMLIRVIEEFTYVANNDLFYDINTVKLTLITAIKDMLKTKEINVDNDFLTEILKRNKIKNIVSKLIFPEGEYSISTFTKDLDLDTSIVDIIKYYGKEIELTTGVNDYLSIVIYILAYSVEGRKDPVKTYIDVILPLTLPSMKIATEQAGISLVERLRIMLLEGKLNV